VKSGKKANGLASIIIPCWNQREFIRHCIAALTRHTRAPWELIAVNNGSTDATADHLAGVQDAASVPVTVIANATNRGFPAAINQGLQVACGEYLVLLNNDAAVTDEWLDQLIALAEAKVGVRARPMREAPAAGQVAQTLQSSRRSAWSGPRPEYAAPLMTAVVPYHGRDQMLRAVRIIDPGLAHFEHLRWNPGSNHVEYLEPIEVLAVASSERRAGD
jgi:glycosyltransferase involved in cell wall biosynthesis